AVPAPGGDDQGTLGAAATSGGRPAARPASAGRWQRRGGCAGNAGTIVGAGRPGRLVPPAAAGDRAALLRRSVGGADRRRPWRHHRLGQGPRHPCPGLAAGSTPIARPGAPATLKPALSCLLTGGSPNGDQPVARRLPL